MKPRASIPSVGCDRAAEAADRVLPPKPGGQRTFAVDVSLPERPPRAFLPLARVVACVIRVGVDAWNIPYDRRGIGRYVRSILHAWRASFADRVEPVLVVPEWNTWLCARRYRNGSRHRVVSRRFHERAGIDVLWFPFNGCSWTSFRLPAAATLHDATNFVIPNTQPEAQNAFHNAVRCCRALITDSRFSQHELASALQIDPSRIEPILLGVEAPRRDTDVAEIAALAPYALYVGADDPRKNLEVLVEAMRDVQREIPSLRLVLAGCDAQIGRRYFRDVLGTALGYVSDAVLAALYRNASVFVFPSRYEGFGIPVLEAMSYGTPVVACDCTAIPEAAGDAALLVPPNDAQQLADAIRRVVLDASLASDLRRRGAARASEMTWTRTASATLDVLERIAQ
jgi:glycosyltransferase involved in cell wall biosynthesis